MPRTRPAAVILIALLAGSARADTVELVGRVTGTRSALVERRVGEARYLAIADVFWRGRNAYLEVLDVESRNVIQVRAARSMFEKRFGVPNDHGMAVPRADVVMYKPGVVGLALAASVAESDLPQQHWYAELDDRTGRLIRSVSLGAVAPGDALQIVGVDVAADTAWFAIAGAREVVLRTVELGSLKVADALRVPRTGKHEPRVHAAPDFSRFAVVDYFEEHVRMSPGKVQVIDRTTGTAFAVPAPPAAYGVAFAPDRRYLYLGSSQRGTIARIDLDARKIDKQVAGPRFLHHLVISPSGRTLYALASSSRYSVYDLPDLKARTERSHPADLAPAMEQLSGHGLASSDGAYFVAPDVDTATATRGYVIARFAD